jgi:hypothetical protein
MKRIFQCLLLCAGIFYGGLTANAQDGHPFALSFEPSYLFNNGLRMNLERKMTKQDWLGVNITGYYSPLDPRNNSTWISNSDFQEIDGLKGLGIGGTYKRYFARICFINLGANYTFFDVRNKAYDYRAFTEDGLVFYEYGYMDKHYYYKKATANITFGIHSTFRHVFFAEPYIGVGLAHSFYDKSYPEKYNDTMFGFGYRGPYFLLGIKLGFNIPPVP